MMGTTASSAKITVTTVPTEVLVFPATPTLWYLTVPTAGATIYLGGPDVTLPGTDPETDGFPLVPGQTYGEESHNTTIYAIADTTDVIVYAFTPRSA